MFSISIYVLMLNISRLMTHMAIPYGQFEQNEWKKAKMKQTKTKIPKQTFAAS